MVDTQQQWCVVYFPLDESITHLHRTWVIGGRKSAKATAYWPARGASLSTKVQESPLPTCVDGWLRLEVEVMCWTGEYFYIL